MREDNNSIIVLAAFAVGLPMLLLWWFSQAIGADFWITGRAVFKSALFFVLAAAALYFIRPNIWLALTGLMLCLWPTWWSVLDSISAGGMDPNQNYFLVRSELWWNSSGFKWSIEALLVGLFAYLFFKELNENRY